MFLTIINIPSVYFLNFHQLNELKDEYFDYLIVSLSYKANSRLARYLGKYFRYIKLDLKIYNKNKHYLILPSLVNT